VKVGKVTKGCTSRIATITAVGIAALLIVLAAGTVASWHQPPDTLASPVIPAHTPEPTEAEGLRACRQKYPGGGDTALDLERYFKYQEGPIVDFLKC
jgi:hypothetical protein